MMRSKSSRHKNENTFKFQSFTDRIAGINIDVLHRIGKRSETPQDADSFFYASLQKWIDLNCTQHFSDFCDEISSQVQSLAQLVFHEAAIVEALKKHLVVPRSQALDPLLDLSVQLARDLQNDFYPKFPEFFQLFVALLDMWSKDASALEKIFTSLTYMFKFLWRYMLTDMEKIFQLYMPLLDSGRKWYIRKFAAESFGFLVRKCKDQDNFLEFMLKNVDANESLMDGVGRLIFEVIKGVKDKLHSNTETILPLLLCKLAPSSEYSSETVLQTLTVTVQCVLQHVSKENLNLVWKILLNSIDVQDKIHKKSYANEERGNQSLYSQNLLKILLIFLEHKEGLIVNNVQSICNVLEKLLHGIKEEDYTSTSTLLSAIATFLTAKKCNVPLMEIPKLISLVFKCRCSMELHFAFCRQMFSAGMFEKDVLPALLIFCHSCLYMKNDTASHDVLTLVTELILSKASPPRDSPGLAGYNSYMLDFGHTCKGTRTSDSFPRLVLSVIEEWNMDNPLEIWSALVCLPHVRPVDEAEYIVKISFAIDKLFNHFESNPDTDEDLAQALLLQAVNCFICVQCPSDFFTSIPWKKLLNVLRTRPHCELILRSVDLYLGYAVKNCNDLLSNDIFKEIYEILKSNLVSSSHEVRLISLRILSLFTLEYPTQDGQITDQPGIFNICLEAEMVPLSVHHYRSKLMHLQKLEYGIVNANLPIPAKDYCEAPLLCLMGNLYINFTLVWEPVKKLIASYAHGLGHEQFWPVFKGHLLKTIEKAEVVAEFGRALPVQDPLHYLESVASDEKLKEFYSTYHSIDVTAPYRADHYNHRKLLWQTMLLFPRVCEAKSQELTPLILRFMQNEFYPADVNVAPTEDISRPRNLPLNRSKIGVENMDIIAEGEEGINDDDDDDDDNGDEVDEKVPAKKKKVPTATLR